MDSRGSWTGHLTKPAHLCFCNEGWICEQHLDQGWPHDDCAGPGALPAMQWRRPAATASRLAVPQTAMTRRSFNFRTFHSLGNGAEPASCPARPASVLRDAQRKRWVAQRAAASSEAPATGRKRGRKPKA